MCSTTKKIYQIQGFPLIKLQTRGIIESTRKGLIYMNSLKSYREKYNKEKDDTIGDPNEGKLIIHDAILLAEDQRIVQKITNQSVATVNENDFVFCMFSVNPDKYTNFTFTEEQKQKLINFNDTAMLITDAHKFFMRIMSAAEQNNYKIKHGFVNYYDETFNNITPLIRMLLNGTENIVFHKTKKYEYQQEYRFTIPNTTGADHLELQIGDISDITEIINTKDLFSLTIEKEILSI